MVRQRQSYCVYRLRVQRTLAGDAANAIGSKKLLHIPQRLRVKGHRSQATDRDGYSPVSVTLASRLPAASRARTVSPGFTSSLLRSSVPSGPYTSAYPRFSTASGDRACRRAEGAPTRFFALRSLFRQAVPCTARRTRAFVVPPPASPSDSAARYVRPARTGAH